MSRHLILGLFLLITGGLLAQEGTNSPYSYFGIGTLKFPGTSENRAMGGLGIFADSIHLNLQNPAAYSHLRLVNYSMGASHTETSQKNDSEAQSSSTSVLDYLVLGIPMGKFGMGMGVIPYSSVGYNFYSDLPNGVTEYSGSGGLNKAFLSLAYQLTPSLSFGVETNYSFGKIENTAITQITDLQYGSRAYNSSELNGFIFNFGALYKRMINNNMEVYGSLTYTPGTNFTSENSRKVATVSIIPSGIYTMDEREVEVADTEFTFPSQFSIGAGIGKPKRWALGAEYTNQQISNFSNRSFTFENVTYKDASKYRVGGYYIPDYNSFGNYFNRVVYRAGLRYEQTGLNVSGQDIDEFGISFGFGLPVGRLFSNANLGFEVGKRGTTNNGLIQENFFSTFLSFSLNDRWFDKRLID